MAVAGSTLVAAALFQPLRRRVQAAVDHRFNRARYDAERTAADFAERLRDEVDVGRDPGAIATAAGAASRPRQPWRLARRPMTAAPQEAAVTAPVG